MPPRSSPNRRPGRKSSQGGGLRQVLLWAFLIIGSFFVGALVVSPILSAVTAGRPPAPAASASQQDARQAPPPARPTPAAPAPAREGPSPDIRIGAPPPADIQRAEEPDTPESDPEPAPRDTDEDEQATEEPQTPGNAGNDAPRSEDRPRGRRDDRRPAAGAGNAPARPSGARDLSVQDPEGID